MAPIRKKSTTALQTKNPSFESSPAVAATTPRVIDINDSRNFAADRPVRSSRNNIPRYNVPLVKRTQSKGKINRRGTSGGKMVKSKRNSAKALTPRKQEIIWNFLRQVSSNPGQFGPVSGDRWIQELTTALREPPRKGKQRLAPITATDVSYWLGNVQFSEILQKIKQEEASTSSSSTSASVSYENQEPNHPTSVAALTAKLFSTSDSTTAQQAPGSDEVRPTSPMTTESFKKLEISSEQMQQPSGSSVQDQSEIGSDDTEEGNAETFILVIPESETTINDDEQQNEVSGFTSDTSQTQEITGISSFAEQLSPMFSYYDKGNNDYGDQPTDEQNRIQVAQLGQRVLASRDRVGYFSQPWTDCETIKNEQAKTAQAKNNGPSAFVAYQQNGPPSLVASSNLSAATDVATVLAPQLPQHPPVEKRSRTGVVTMKEAVSYNNSVPAASVRELRQLSNTMVRIFNNIGHAGYANNPSMTVLRHQLNAIQDLLFYFSYNPNCRF